MTSGNNNYDNDGTLLYGVIVPGALDSNFSLMSGSHRKALYKYYLFIMNTPFVITFDFYIVRVEWI